MLVSNVEDRTKLVAYSFKTHTWTDLAKGSFRNWFVSPDGSYVYFENIESSRSRVQRVRLADHRIQDITTLKSFRRAEDEYLGTWLGVAPDGSPAFTRDIGTQEIYALDVKWP